MCGAELKPLPEGVRRVAAVLQEHGHADGPVMLEDAARTAQQAADALGIDVGQIAKSIVFRRIADDAAVLVIASGDRRVDEAKVAALVGAIGRADAAFVKAKTGFAIGGVSPVGHAVTPVTLIDRDLFRFADIWAAAGHPHAVFRLAPHDLERLTGAPVADVTPSPAGSAHAIGLLTSRSVEALAATADLPSPCISICRMNAASALCEGCFRTLDEIRAWSRMDDQDKKSTWLRIAQRAGLHEGRSAGTT